MSNIFDEVDEDLRRERYKSLWDRFGPYVIGFAVLLVAGTAGYEGYKAWSTSRSLDESNRYLAEIKRIEDGQTEGALENLEALAVESSTGYQALALFHAGALKLESGDETGAMETYDSLARNSSVPALLRALGELKAANIALDIEPYDQVVLRVAPMLDEDHPFRLSALELAGLNAKRAGKIREAEAHFQTLLDTPEVQPSMVSRINTVLTLLQSAKPPAAGTN